MPRNTPSPEPDPLEPSAVEQAPRPYPPSPAEGGSYLLDEEKWEWVKQDP